jgi:hypothetical protein
MTKIVATLACAGAMALAADKPAEGTWKLNMDASTFKGCPVDRLRVRTLVIPSDIAKASTTPRKAASPRLPVMHFESISERTLVATPATPSECRLVYDKQ